jgi:hypothetical protein
MVDRAFAQRSLDRMLKRGFPKARACAREQRSSTNYRRSSATPIPAHHAQHRTRIARHRRRQQGTLTLNNDHAGLG